MSKCSKNIYLSDIKARTSNRRLNDVVMLSCFGLFAFYWKVFFFFNCFKNILFQVTANGNVSGRWLISEVVHCHSGKHNLKKKKLHVPFICDCFPPLFITNYEQTIWDLKHMTHNFCKDVMLEIPIQAHQVMLSNHNSKELVWTYMWNDTKWMAYFGKENPKSHRPMIQFL